jgi:hypothetical protein
MCDNRSIYVMLPLGSEEEWHLHKTYARDSGLKGAEVVAECAPLHGGVMTVHMMGMTMEGIIVDPIVIEVPSEERGVLLIGSAWVESWQKQILNLLTLHWLDRNLIPTCLMRILTMSKILIKMMNHQVARAMKKTCKLCLTQLVMYQSPQLAKAMSQICPSQRLMCVMSQHQVVLTGGYITLRRS